MIIKDTESVNIHTSTGPMRTYLFRPAADSRYPGLLLYSEIFQVTGPIRRTAAMLASHGFVVAVPEIYHELEPAGPHYDPAGAGSITAWCWAVHAHIEYRIRARSSRSICYATGVCGSVLVVEHSFTCPFCGEEISMVLDLSVHRHSYVEDCQVCCNPLEISYTVEDDALAEFEAKCLE